MKQRNTLF